MYTLLYIPNDGLFYDGGAFLDGHQERINWNRTIPLYNSHSRAVSAKERILERYPNEYANGQIIVLAVQVQDKK
jgi:hypothetical protein